MAEGLFPTTSWKSGPQQGVEWERELYSRKFAPPEGATKSSIAE